ncbi:glutathione S-transferase N-terminal domain-containing protein [Mesorhizobium xinjiangense]|uniref:glutathione S-transferase N-terminal domain-containing protein n=1 Tax=Mesorhizobium xinjiangense TaxID=2678685 RepID=UPI0012EE334F|nr:glutathione S-transferase C-terminal domain-containing protein [Mesorhizobium xinjiangense]
MKLYYFADGCSLASHIALNEADIAVEPIKVDVETRQTEQGRPFAEINPKGYVPALVFDDDAMLTENIAILDWIAQQAPALKPADEMARTRQNEMLAFISTELHKSFLGLFFLPGEDAKPIIADSIASRFSYLSERLANDYLLGERFSVADAFLYVMLRWAKMSDMTTPDIFEPYVERIEARPAVQATLRAEGLA